MATTAVRFDPSLRRTLEAAASANGRSLSEEVRIRLAASLDGQDVIAAFGDAETYALCRLFAKALFNIRRELGERWYTHPLAWREAEAAIRVLLSHFQPLGKEVAPEDHPLLMGMRQAGFATDEQIELVRQQIENHPSGRLIALNIIAGIERGDFGKGSRLKVNQLHEIGQSLASIIATTGMGGDAAAALDAERWEHLIGIGPGGRPWAEMSETLKSEHAELLTKHGKAKS